MPHSSRKWFTYRNNKHIKVCLECDKHLVGDAAGRLYFRIHHPGVTPVWDNDDCKRLLECGTCGRMTNPRRKSCKYCHTG